MGLYFWLRINVDSFEIIYLTARITICIFIWCFVLSIIYTLCKWVKDSISARTTSNLEFTIAGLASILALIVRVSRRVFVFAIGILNFRTGDVRSNENGWNYNGGTAVLRYYYAIAVRKKNLPQHIVINANIGGPSDRIKRSLRSIGIADCVYLRGNCYDNHRCYFHALRSANYSLGRISKSSVSTDSFVDDRRSVSASRWLKWWCRLCRASERVYRIGNKNVRYVYYARSLRYDRSRSLWTKRISQFRWQACIFKTVYAK